ncbi:MAG: glyceraldehyde 3-phosphate dehydrogenase NAD-binding domain-containing protein, partial [Patescibacteria group bacterium]
MKKIKVGINGFGRIGRVFLKIAWERPEIEIVAVNDLSDVANMGYLLKHDTAYGEWKHPVRVEVSNGTGDNYIVIDENKRVKVLAEKNPKLLPWKDLGIDVVVESTGLFVTYEQSKMHLEAGAKKVVI